MLILGSGFLNLYFSQIFDYNFLFCGNFVWFFAFSYSSWGSQGRNIEVVCQSLLQCQKAKWLSKEALQITEKRRETKGKGERERYAHLNAEFQRIARRYKKAFLGDQCKEIEENNRVGKTRNLFKKIKSYQGNISCKDGLNKGQKWYGPNRRRRY